MADGCQCDFLPTPHTVGGRDAYKWLAEQTMQGRYEVAYFARVLIDAPDGVLQNTLRHADPALVERVRSLRLPELAEELPVDESEDDEGGQPPKSPSDGRFTVFRDPDCQPKCQGTKQPPKQPQPGSRKPLGPRDPGPWGKDGKWKGG